MPDPLVSVSDLSITLASGKRKLPVVRDVSFDIAEGQAVALVGESGAGKSMTGRAIARLLPPGATVSGRVDVRGRDVLRLSGRELQAYRMNDVGVIFQDPRAAVDPVRRVGEFLIEALRVNRRVPRAEAMKTVAGILQEVGVSNPERRMMQFPHELSGGLLQRVMIASVLAMRPKLVIADEPTTALDVTAQADVMAILKEMQENDGVALLLITHDLELASAVCDETVVMYAGTVMERRASESMMREPAHPYSAALITSRPVPDGVVNGKLPVIPGVPLSASEATTGCVFASRCSFVQDRCREVRPELKVRGDGAVACHRADELAGAVWPTNGQGSRIDA